MTKRHLVLVLAVAAASCKKDKPAAQSENAKPNEGSATAPGAGSSVAPAVAPVVAPAAAGSVFASIDDYCKSTTATFKKDDCERPSDGDMCFCAAATAEDLKGPFTAKNAGGAVLEAALVRVANSAAGYVECGLALKFADGWRVQAGLFACGAAPAAHDGAMNVEVAAFTLVKDVVEIQGATSYDTMDVDPNSLSGTKDVAGKPEKFSVRCEVAGSTATCKTTK